MSRSFRSFILFAVPAGLVAAPAIARSQERIALKLDTAQASAVLALLDAGAGVPESDPRWQRLFASEGYVRLKAREVGMRRAFADSTFVAFVRSDTLRARRAALRRTLHAWSRASVNASAGRALAYLPDEARIRATIYIVIKPRTNTFVWDVEKDPAIFLYLDPAVTTLQFENTVAHELHHIGFASVQAGTDSLRASIPDSARAVATWLGAFAEGFAMLAAAGGPQVHPHVASAPAERARWDGDVARFDNDLRTLERFFLDALSGRIAADSIAQVAGTFYGVQGPWYTVGWKMAVTIEQAFGRAELIRCMRDPRRALARYNAAVAKVEPRNRGAAATWSPALIAALGVH
jgi:hypothetical protein